MCAELPRVHEFDGAGAEPCRQQAVDARRRAAALEVPEHDHPGFLAGEPLELGHDPHADAPQPLGVLAAGRFQE
jgi:hypothetical protein